MIRVISLRKISSLCSGIVLLSLKEKYLSSLILFGTHAMLLAMCTFERNLLTILGAGRMRYLSCSNTTSRKCQQTVRRKKLEWVNLMALVYILTLTYLASGDVCDL